MLPIALGAPADARRHPNVPSTGLAPIAYGKPAPNFTYDIGNGPQRLSDALGLPVLVHFWASWCDPCKDELPLLVRAQREDPKLVVIMLSDEKPGAARAYLKKQGIDFPVAEDTDRTVFKLYGVQPIPVSVFLRPDGTVEHVSVGEMDWNEIAAALAGLEPSLTPLGSR